MLFRSDEAIKIYGELAQSNTVPADVREQAEMGVALATESKGALQKAKAEYQHVADAYSGTDEALIAQMHIKELESPGVDRFYNQLRDYKPPQLSTDLPGKAGDDSDVPPIPRSKSAGKDVGKNLGLDLEKVDVPPAPKGKDAEKKPGASTKPADKPAAKPAEKPSDKPAPASPKPAETKK